MSRHVAQIAGVGLLRKRANEVGDDSFRNHRPLEALSNNVVSGS